MLKHFRYSNLNLLHFSRPKQTPLTREAGFEKGELGQSNVVGRDSLSQDYTTTSILSKMALRSFDRLVAADKPFSLSVHINAPHPPMVATSSYLDYYHSQRGKLFVPPSVQDAMLNSEYRNFNNRLETLKHQKYNSIPHVQDLTSHYYGMIEGTFVSAVLLVCFCLPF